MNLSMDSSGDFFEPADEWFASLSNPFSNWLDMTIFFPVRDRLVYLEEEAMVDPLLVWGLRVLFGIVFAATVLAIFVGIYYAIKYLVKVILDAKDGLRIRHANVERAAQTKSIAVRPKPTPRVSLKKPEKTRTKPDVTEEIADDTSSEADVSSDEPKSATIASSLKNYLLEVMSEYDKNPESTKEKLEGLLSTESEYSPLLDKELRKSIQGIIDKIDHKFVVEAS